LKLMYNIHMALAEPYPNQPEKKHEELFDPEELFDYLQTRYAQAYSGEDMDYPTINRSTRNGRLYQRMRIPGAEHHPGLKDSTRIVLRPPFSTLMLAQEAEFIESYAVFLRGEDGHEVGDESGELADQYLVRLVSRGKYGAFELVRQDGTFLADLSSFTPHLGFGILEEDADVPHEQTESEKSEEDSDTAQEVNIGDVAVLAALDSELDPFFKPIERAQALFHKVSHMNLVPVRD
jgi:hypothetical protein